MEAIPIWEKLIHKIKVFSQVSNGYLAECHYHLAEIYNLNNNHYEARKELMHAAKYAEKFNSSKELDGSIIKFKDIKAEINNALKYWDFPENYISNL